MLAKTKFIDPNLPNNVARGLESMLFAAPISTLAYALGLIVMAAALWLRTGDVVIVSYSAALIALIAWRVLFVRQYRSACFFLPALLVFGLVYSALLAALVIRAFSVDDQVAIALVVIAAAGYLSGVTIRASAMPTLAIPHASALFAPLVVAAMTRGSEHWAVAILLICYWVGSIQLIITTHDRIRAQLVAEDRMARAALTDALTGLANRTAFDIALTDRLKSGPAAVIAIVDLDRFKPINDTYGHDAGDELLKSVTDRMLANLADYHLVARLGGDEFAILFDAGLEVADATRVAERIVRVLELPFAIADTNVTIGASIGLAVATEGDDARALKRRADDRLYNVKRGGRGYVASKDETAAAA